MRDLAGGAAGPQSEVGRGPGSHGVGGGARVLLRTEEPLELQLSASCCGRSWAGLHRHGVPEPRCLHACAQAAEAVPPGQRQLAFLRARWCHSGSRCDTGKRASTRRTLSRCSTASRIGPRRRALLPLELRAAAQRGHTSAEDAWLLSEELLQKARGELRVSVPPRHLESVEIGYTWYIPEI
jgi:hypothetical protein